MYRMFSQVYEPKGYAFDYITPDEVSTNLAAHLDERTRIVWIESPTNPLLNIVDIRAAADAAHAAGALLVVDNTFATPYLQQPLELGADIVVHSTTKYLGGHSDVVGGFAGTNDPTISERLRFLQKSLGAVPGPFDAWLVLRGLKTLAVRMRQHCENARAVVAFLQEHPRVDEGALSRASPTTPDTSSPPARCATSAAWSRSSLESEEEAVALVARTKVWTLAESLGGVESLIEHPFRMTHASTADGPFASPRNLVRLSVGIESADDLVADLEQALAPVRKLRVPLEALRRPLRLLDARRRAVGADLGPRRARARTCRSASRESRSHLSARPRRRAVRIASSRPSTSILVMPPSSPPTSDLKLAPICEPMCARAHGQTEDLAEDLLDLVARDVVRRRDQHRRPPPSDTFNARMTLPHTRSTSCTAASARNVGCYLVDTDDGPALFDCGPTRACRR